MSRRPAQSIHIPNLLLAPMEGRPMVRRSLFLMLVAALCSTTALLAQGAGRITGRVTDASTQQPVAGANVTIGARTVITNADGRYAIGAQPGDHTVTVSLVGYRAASRTVTIG